MYTNVSVPSTTYLDCCKSHPPLDPSCILFVPPDSIAEDADAAAIFPPIVCLCRRDSTLDFDIACKVVLGCCHF